jgi:hypothetical protein
MSDSRRSGPSGGRKNTGRKNAGPLVTLSLVLAGAGCAAGEERPRSPEQARLQQAAQGLCDAEALARSGELGAARARFYDRSHAYLHEIAALVTERDPQAVATLLEAKQRLESTLKRTLDVGADRGGAEVADLFAEVGSALGAAARAAELEQPVCRNEEAA